MFTTFPRAFHRACPNSPDRVNDRDGKSRARRTRPVARGRREGRSPGVDMGILDGKAVIVTGAGGTDLTPEPANRARWRV
jgi:hypothetical protein